ncbi:hypothetical protein BDN70DRAFT_343937 [Pholiota conissans]|uniref:Uncharacterized protein n=1 Tax=Pholiota conissans TaxID=109636 RepID=A0A9P5YRZ4_9AGAR|nr:hypothetical protein BDN70DRAFT_343937 [Pholiota conissans]
MRFQPIFPSSAHISFISPSKPSTASEPNETPSSIPFSIPLNPDVDACQDDASPRTPRPLSRLQTPRVLPPIQVRVETESDTRSACAIYVFLPGIIPPSNTSSSRRC